MNAGAALTNSKGVISAMADTDPTTDDLDRREQVARIDKMLVENRKLLAETDKLLAESLKFAAEARKYRWVDPLLAFATVIAALGISRFLGH